MCLPARREMMGSLHQFTPSVERLGIAAFRTGQEALHCIAWMGRATVCDARPVFPTLVRLSAAGSANAFNRR
ncbi:hypothetical protein [Streptomyces lanatus]|uniref:Uncharacterized protein n=1 Tax=Streptomyces lanatus TaxID=66900 RepID=A0ABV1XVR0_9ACTN|nr:hypothetical protein GCM10018780_00050 [Streptomyces lanatus]